MVSSKSLFLIYDAGQTFIGAVDEAYVHAQGYLTYIAGSPFIAMAAACGDILRG